MERRKLIGCIINCPENIYQSRILDGLMSRCEAYDYDLAVFSPLVNTAHANKEYLKTEFNLLDLINYEHLDAVVVASLPLIAMGDTSIYDAVAEHIKKHCTKPVVSLDMPLGEHTTVYTDDITPFCEITRHIFDVHKCKNVYFLAGRQVDGVADRRLEGFRKECDAHGITVDDDKVFYGDFWYTSGAALADRILSGELETPDAVICANDHMAIGLAKRLNDSGISVPEQVIVTGYDATQEAMINELCITTYEPNNRGMAEEAIDRIRLMIEPGKELIPTRYNVADGLCIGLSCGCKIDHKNLMRSLTRSLYRYNRNYADDSIKNNEDICSLMDSYMLEVLTESRSPEECLGNIAAQTYLIKPYDKFYLCLRRNWLDVEYNSIKGFPNEMRVNAMAVSDERKAVENIESFHCNDDRQRFQTSIMLPALYEQHDVPRCFYFIPVHFMKNTFGYAVLEADTKMRVKPTNVLRNWVRTVNNALEMTRVNNMLVDVSELDKLTGLKNRRGMDNGLKEILRRARKTDYFYCIVFDIDGLKHINDNFGHNEGDYAIKSIASAVARVTDENEVSVRAGGDEFYLLGVNAGATDKTMIDKVSAYRNLLDDINYTAKKPYRISASAGFCIKQLAQVTDINELINAADRYMYVCKAESKRRKR
ncbi:MAG: GGDEF domain-containing protein [Ruminococcaceae bacterium]|nr:GGDEF domain-containing protein [Oscillospiraceae bacterium]